MAEIIDLGEFRKRKGQPDAIVETDKEPAEVIPMPEKVPPIADPIEYIKENADPALLPQILSWLEEIENEYGGLEAAEASWEVAKLLRRKPEATLSEISSVLF